MYSVCIYVCMCVCVCTVMPAIYVLYSFYHLFFIFTQYVLLKTCRFQRIVVRGRDMFFTIHQMKRCVATRLVKMKRYESYRRKREYDSPLSISLRNLVSNMWYRELLIYFDIMSLSRDAHRENCSQNFYELHMVYDICDYAWKWPKSQM